MRTFLLILLGALIMYVILRVMAKQTVSSDSTSKLIILLQTQKVNNLIKTNEFREVAKTSEFQDFINTLAEEQLIAVSKALVS
jgi:hypothetical protein